MSAKGGPVLTFLHLTRQGGPLALFPPVSYVTVHLPYSALRL